MDRVALVIDAYLPQHLGRDAVAARQRTARETAAAVITSALGVGAGDAFLAGMQSKTPADLVFATGTCRSVALSRAVSRSVSRSVSQSVSQSASQSASQPVCQSVSQSVSQSVRRAYSHRARSARTRHARSPR